MYFLEKIKSELARSINKILAQEIVTEADFVYPPQIDLGDLSLPLFKTAKAKGESPAKLAGELVSALSALDIPGIGSLSAVGPYLNIKLNSEFLARAVLKAIGVQPDWFGRNGSGQEKRVMIEFSNSNTHKEFHIGHLRNICFGDSVNRLLKANGFKNLPVSYINDFGIHVAKTIWWTYHPDNKYAKEMLAAGEIANKGLFLGQMYAESVKEMAERKTAKLEIEFIMKKIELRQGGEYKIWEETRQWTIGQFQAIYDELGVHFVRQYYESEFIDRGRVMVDELLAKGILRKSEGAVIADLEEYGLGVLVFIRSDGTATYPVADLPLASAKFKDYQLDKSIYIVDNRQRLYFQQLFKILELLGYKQEKIHLEYDFVKLASGMMSSRSGNTVTYDELKAEMLEFAKKETGLRHGDWPSEKIGEVAQVLTLGAMKFEMLKVGTNQVITFDPEKALSFQGYTAAYLQYAYARVQSLLRKEGTAEQDFSTVDFALLQEAKEHELLLSLAKYPEVIKAAGESFDPSEIARYLFELAQLFNDYYHQVPVLKAEEAVKQARLVLVSGFGQVIKNGLGVLGIGVVEEM